MKRKIFAITIVTLSALLASDGIVVRPILTSPEKTNWRMASRLIDLQSANPKSAAVGPQDKVVPKIAFGDGWETVFVVVNMSTQTLSYKTFFIDAAGNYLPATFRTYPDNQLITSIGTDSRLPAGASFNFSLFDDGGPLREGWALLNYDETQGRLGIYALLRHKAITGDFNFEATVALSSLQDFQFFVPFDNIQGFQTRLSLTNPAPNIPANIRLTFLNLSGKLLFQDFVKLQPGQQLSGVIPEIYPDLADSMGTILVQGDTNRLSAFAFRTNLSTGAIANIPIMNWSAMLQ